ncbi:MAG TPA: hypothetical protein VF202_09360 [Trueperaceae bacterium]
MRLVGLETASRDGRVRLSGWVERRGRPGTVEVYFEYGEDLRPFVRESADAFFPVLLVASMLYAEPLRLDAPVSADLLRGARELQAVFSQWYPEELSEVEVTAEEASPSRVDAGASASFFSLGVDSFYTLLKPANDAMLGYLIYVLGVEKPLSTYGRGQHEPVVRRVEQVAAATGKKTIIGWTNLRDVFPLDWSRHLHGAGLASVAHSLGRGLGAALVPSTHPYRDMLPWGSTPLTDRLWSSELVRIVHDGAEAARVDKIAGLLVDEPLAVQHLRVCTENDGGPDNCGRCSKCVRTMLTLQLLGRLSSAPTFPPELPPDYARRLRHDDENDVSFIRENLELARRVGADRRVVRTLERLVLASEAEAYCEGRGFFPSLAGLLGWYAWTRNVLRLKEWYARSQNPAVRFAWRRLKGAFTAQRREPDADRSSPDAQRDAVAWSGQRARPS